SIRVLSSSACLVLPPLELRRFPAGAVLRPGLLDFGLSGLRPPLSAGRHGLGALRQRRAPGRRGHRRDHPGDLRDFLLASFPPRFFGGGGGRREEGGGDAPSTASRFPSPVTTGEESHTAI